MAKYSTEFKLHAVELYLRTEVSYKDLALQLKINNPPLLAQWVQRFLAVGIDGLKLNWKGWRPKVPDKPIVATPTQSNGFQYERLKQLEEKNLKLRIEVAYLKDLRSGLATLFRTIFQRSACLNSTGLLYPKLP